MKRLARRLHRRFRSQRGTSGRKQTTRATRLEQLEPRQIMAADGLAFAQSTITSANTLNTIPFVVEGNSQPVAISFHVHATGGSLDPATPQVLTGTGAVVPAMYSSSDYAGTNDGLLVVELAAGSYRIQIGGEQGSIGSFDLHAGLPGDLSGNGQVSKSENQHVAAAILQSHMGFTNVSAQVFKKLGIDVSKNLYRSELDVNSNNKIDTFDQSVIEASVGSSSVEVEFMLDDVSPTITAALVGDTGRSNSDGITNNLSATINGTLSDAMPIATFTASIDGSTAINLATLLGQSFTNGGNFSITRQQLEQVAGNVTVANNGSHTLLLTARDQQGNTSTRQVTFQFDTVPPAAPTALDLDSSTDTGSSNSDNNTRQQQLQLRANAESNAIVQFFSSLVTGSIGQATASPDTVTTGTLAQGNHNITATATDVAGNVSSSSAALAVTIDTTAPTAATLDLDEASDTGTLGDRLTTLSSVTLEGTTSANAAVELRRGGVAVVTGTATGAGSFSFSSVTLPAGASSFQVVATDLAGNSSTSAAQIFTRNSAPTAENQSFQVSQKHADNTVVGTVVADDQDDDTLIFGLVGGEFPAGAFTVDANTGQIRVFNADDLESGGSYTLLIQVTDEHGETLAAPITVTLNTLVNLPPVAQDDDVTTNENAAAIDISVLANNGHGADSDGDDPIASLTISAFDVTSDHGATISLQPNGVLRYDPAGVAGRNALAVGETLVDTFSYTIMDPLGATSTATVTATITGVNDDPTAKADALATTEDASIAFDPRTDHGSGADSDPDTTDVLTVSLPSATSARGAAITVNASGSITYNPLTSAALQTLLPSDPPIVDTFQYTISDGHGGTSMATVSVTVTGVEDDPSMLSIADQDVFAGAPLIIALNGIDADSEGLTFTAMSDNGTLLQPIVYSTSRSLSITLAGYGEMRFYLFEELVPGITQHIIDLVESGILDDTIFHRVIEAFVAQGLDPTGTGMGHPGLIDFDDQYHPDLQHTGSGLLSMAKGGDDTNSSQIFITDYRPGEILDSGLESTSALRRLDFNHSVFGRLTLGESIRQQIMLVNTNSSERPLVDLVVEDIRIIEDDFNAVLMLKAPNGMTGATEVTVTVEDTEGNQSSQSFDVAVTADPFNGVPFLSEVPASATTTVNTDVDIVVEAFDDEGEAVTILALEVGLETKILFENSGNEAGITAPGTTFFAIRNSNWTGGEVATNANTALFTSGTHGYTFGSEGMVTFDVPVTFAEMYFVHASGGAQTATAYNATGGVVATWNSILATEFNDPDNFTSRTFSTPVKRIEFSGGTVDNFFYRNSTVGLTSTIDQTTDTVTVTPPTGFIGTMAILVGTQQSSGTPATVDQFDRQVIPITVLPAAPLTAAEGGSGQASSTATICDDDPQLTAAFQSALATWQSVLGLAEMPDVQLNVADLGGALLGSTSILASDASGLPTSSIITIEDDGAGRGWHTAADQNVAADRYDLYTVMLHEVGDAIGFDEVIDALGLSESALEAYFDDYGHLLGETDDLMSDVLGLGERHLPSALDADILQLALGIDDSDSSALDAALAG